jgi:hypothetical protein
MVFVLSLGLPPSHPDHALLKRIEDKILEHAKGWERFRRDIPNLIRQGIDEVIDSDRTLRFTYNELESIEKAYLSPKMKILVRHHLAFERGTLLDMSVGGVELGIASASGSRWVVPIWAVGRPYLLIKYNERTARCSIGLAVITARAVVSAMRPRRRSGPPLLPVRWLLRDQPYRMNPWEEVYAAS